MLDIKKKNIGYLIFTMFLIIVNFIYSKYAHNVSSIFMTFMFIIPLLGLLLSFISNKYRYQNLLGAATLTITLASLLQGIVVIAGTTTNYVYILLGIGIVLLILALFNK